MVQLFLVIPDTEFLKMPSSVVLHFIFKIIHQRSTTGSIWTENCFLFFFVESCLKFGKVTYSGLTLRRKF